MRVPNSVVASLLAALVGVTDAAENASSTPAAQQAVAKATGAALQANMGAALAELRAVNGNQFSGVEARFRHCVLARFGEQTNADPLGPKLDPFTEQVFDRYRDYWRTSLLDPGARESALAHLETELRAILGANVAAGFEAVEQELQRQLSARSYHVLLGQTGLLREFMLWRQQSSLTYQVHLPEGEHQTRVEVLDGFVSRGWTDYATCRLRGTGGWAKDGVLFAVRPRYASLDNEEFQVTFLGHETQHAVDLREFPDLEPWQLEYRAKLVELALARETRAQVLGKFSEDQGDDRASPHSYANRRVLLDLRRALRLEMDADLNEQPVSSIQQAAANLLRADGAKLRSKKRAQTDVVPA
jgi:hypothetical protein